MSIQKELSELIREEVITQEIADRIEIYYKSKESSSANRLFSVLGGLGATLVGLGIILIVAHNWYDLGKTVQTTLGLLPLFIGQLFCALVLHKKRDNRQLSETATVLLFFGIGASIALVSQIYQISGDLGNFLFTWLLLILPMIYLMKSSLTSLLYIATMTYYVSEVGYWQYPTHPPLLYLVLLVGILPYYYQLYKKAHHSNFMLFHNWMMPLSLLIALGTFSENNHEALFVSYITLFALYFIVGEINLLKSNKITGNGYLIIGSLGTIILLLTLSTEWLWENLNKNRLQITSIEFIIASLISMVTLLVLIYYFRQKSLWKINPTATLFIPFFFIFFMINNSSLASALINLFIFSIGIYTVVDGAKKCRIGILNYGLIIISSLAVIRFFDSQISFIIRGTLFILVGVGFFVANYLLLKKRAIHE